MVYGPLYWNFMWRPRKVIRTLSSYDLAYNTCFFEMHRFHILKKLIWRYFMFFKEFRILCAIWYIHTPRLYSWLMHRLRYYEFAIKIINTENFSGRFMARLTWLFWRTSENIIPLSRSESRNAKVFVDSLLLVMYGPCREILVISGSWNIKNSSTDLSIICSDYYNWTIAPWPKGLNKLVVNAI